MYFLYIYSYMSIIWYSLKRPKMKGNDEKDSTWLSPLNWFVQLTGTPESIRVFVTKNEPPQSCVPVSSIQMNVYFCDPLFPASAGSHLPFSGLCWWRQGAIFWDLMRWRTQSWGEKWRRRSHGPSPLWASTWGHAVDSLTSPLENHLKGPSARIKNRMKVVYLDASLYVSDFRFAF
jgi:hypothetical protein